MSYEVKLKNRVANVELIGKEGDQVLIAVDGKEYSLDFVKLSKGKYSILHRNKSFYLELIPGSNAKKYHVNTYNKSFDVEIVDAEAKYLANRQKGTEDEGESVITAPIPGRVIKVMVEKGEEVEAGQNLIILSAMKMESEFKASKTGKVSDIKVSEGQSVEANQELVVLEYLTEDTLKKPV